MTLGERLTILFQFDIKTRMRFYRKLSQLLRNGVSLDAGLTQIAFLEKKRRRHGLADLILKWRNQVENGVNFGTCIGYYVPTGESMLLESGSDSGKLQDSLLNAAEAVEAQRRVKNAIISSGAYPALLIVILIAALAMASYNVIPTFAEVMPIEDWTGTPQKIAYASNFIKENGLMIFMILLSAMIIISYSLPRWTGKSRMVVEKIVPWSVYRMWQGSSFLLSIASLMSSGVKIDGVSLRRISNKVPPYLSERINAISHEISAGHNLGEAMARTGFDFPDEELIDDLRVYATLKGFEDNLVNVTREWVQDVETNISSAMKIANTVALVLIAVTMGLLITALFGVVQQIQAASSL